MRRTIAAVLGVAAIAIALGVSPSSGAAQIPGMPGPPRLWSPSIGVRGGWFLKDQSPSIGAVLIVPFPIPFLGPTLVGGVDAIFQDGLREYQGTADIRLNVVPGLYVGGGPAVMDTYFGTSTIRERKTGFSLVAGLRGGGGRISSTVEVRKMRVDSRRPTSVSLILSYRLLGLLGL